MIDTYTEERVRENIGFVENGVLGIVQKNKKQPFPFDKRNKKHSNKLSHHLSSDLITIY